MFAFVPDVQRLTQIFAQATAPTFFLGAVAGFVSLMSSRLSTVVARLRQLKAGTSDGVAMARSEDDIERLRHRMRLLRSGISDALHAGICATLLLAILFVSEFLGLEYAYGAGVLFLVSTCFLGSGLFRFAQEARIGLVSSDEYE